MRFAHLVLGPVSLLAFSAFASGCSDPVPPTPQGAFSVSFSNGDHSAAECSTSQHNKKVGEVSADKKETLVVDGAESATVTCTVSGSSSFSVEGKVGQSGSYLNINVPSITTGATKDAPVAGVAAYASDKSGGESFVSPEASLCVFYFEEKTEQSVSAGKAWLTFECPTVNGGEGKVCAITKGYAIFENCAE